MHLSRLALVAASLLPGATTAAPKDITKNQPHFYVASPEAGSIKIVKAAKPEYGRTLHIVSKKAQTRAWDVQVITKSKDAIKAGRSIQITYYARTVTSEADQGGGFMVAITDESKTGQAAQLANARVASSPGWLPYHHSFKAPHDIAAGDLKAALHFASRKQTLEVAGLKILDYGDTPLSKLPKRALTYDGREPDAAWRAPAAKRIAEHRMGDFTVRVVDAEGKPLSGAKAEVEMTRHAFPFGSAVSLDLLVAKPSELPVYIHQHNIGRADAERYREIAFANFNRITPEAAMRPHILHLTENSHLSKHAKLYLKKRTFRERALAQMRERGIDVRAHYLSWGAIEHSKQQSRRSGTPEDHRAYMEEVIEQAVELGGDYTTEWDVLNHPCGWGRTLADLHGGYDIHAWIMEKARAALPEGTSLAINEGDVITGGGRRDDYERIIKHMIGEGQKPDTIGMMAHFTANALTGIPKCYEVIDRFAQLGPEVALTELDIDAAEDEQLQADYLRDLMTITFSHPHVNQIVMWGFWENCHWKPGTALWRADWSIKPAGQAWLDLVKRDWWTKVGGTSGGDGTFSGRGFKGEHRAVAILPNGRRIEAEFKIGDEPAQITLGL